MSQSSFARDGDARAHASALSSAVMSVGAASGGQRGGANLWPRRKRKGASASAGSRESAPPAALQASDTSAARFGGTVEATSAKGSPADNSKGRGSATMANDTRGFDVSTDANESPSRFKNTRDARDPSHPSPRATRRTLWHATPVRTLREHQRRKCTDGYRVQRRRRTSTGYQVYRVPAWFRVARVDARVYPRRTSRQSLRLRGLPTRISRRSSSLGVARLYSSHRKCCATAGLSRNTASVPTCSTLSNNRAAALWYILRRSPGTGSFASRSWFHLAPRPGVLSHASSS